MYDAWVGFMKFKQSLASVPNDYQFHFTLFSTFLKGILCIHPLGTQLCISMLLPTKPELSELNGVAGWSFVNLDPPSPCSVMCSGQFFLSLHSPSGSFYSGITGKQSKGTVTLC